MKNQHHDPEGLRAALVRSPERGSLWRHKEHQGFIIKVVGMTGPNLSKRVLWVGRAESGETDIRAFNTKFEELHPSHTSS